jgi:hypothetical protein
MEELMVLGKSKTIIEHINNTINIIQTIEKLYDIKNEILVKVGNNEYKILTRYPKHIVFIDNAIFVRYHNKSTYYPVIHGLNKNELLESKGIIINKKTNSYQTLLLITHNCSIKFLDEDQNYLIELASNTGNKIYYNILNNIVVIGYFNNEDRYGKFNEKRFVYRDNLRNFKYIIKSDNEKIMYGVNNLVSLYYLFYSPLCLKKYEEDLKIIYHPTESEQKFFIGRLKFIDIDDEDETLIHNFELLILNKQSKFETLTNLEGIVSADFIYTQNNLLHDIEYYMEQNYVNNYNPNNNKLKYDGEYYYSKKYDKINVEPNVYKIIKNEDEDYIKKYTEEYNNNKNFEHYNLTNKSKKQRKIQNIF